MANVEYVVMRRAADWCFTRDGERIGPFMSEKIAIDAAVIRAKIDFETGSTARVLVNENDEGGLVVYDSGSE